jgi:peptide/nickel transport system ATP-binding protein
MTNNNTPNTPLLKVENLSVSFKMYDSKLGQRGLVVISDLTVSVNEGEILAIVGSSGSGKSLLAHAVLGILPDNATTNGIMFYKGELLTEKMQKELRGKEIALVPQSTAYLDPLMKVGKQVRGTDKSVSKRIAQKKIFKRFELEETVDILYPFQLSGGMARRVLVSTAVISDASLIIADEPTPGMNMEQALEALQVFRELANEGKGVILITHDIDLAVHFADKIAVFYGGTTLEVAPVNDFNKGIDFIRHPYSKALWNALPQNGFTPIAGTQPYAGTHTEGCVFAPRCHNKTVKCLSERPEMRDLRDGYVRCFYAT